MLVIVLKVAFILHPRLGEIVEIGVAKCIVHLGLVVVDQAVAVELLVSPLTEIGDLPVGIVQRTVSMDIPILPLTIIDPALFVKELSSSLALPINEHPLVKGAVFVVLGHDLCLSICAFAFTFRGLLSSVFGNIGGLFFYRGFRFLGDVDWRIVVNWFFLNWSILN